jgi:acyl-CoA dehydrogenase
MADMVNNSRLSNGVRAAGLMRRALSESLFIARERRAFGKRLIDMPLMRRQLLKLMLPTEQARTMVLQTADALRRADAGDAMAYALVRILTPLIKFRACRDARKVTGDAMEVRGGCGYIEEWSDARLVRDAHLGSIWEGTSNIVALDVQRAIRRDAALPALQAHLRGLLDDTPLHADARTVFEATLKRALARAARAAEAKAQGEAVARQIASALYHLSTSIGMAWEAGRTRSAQRMQLAQWVLRQRVLPHDPLADEGAEPLWLPALLEPAGAVASGGAEVESVNLFGQD